jgi:hypothetical protein
MTAPNNKSKFSDFSVFGAKPKDAVLLPSSAMNVRNNCQSGQWTIGDRDYGSKCSMTILKFSRFFGSLGQTSNTLWGQLWFIAESGELPQGVVMVTYLKNRNLDAFNNLIAEVQSKGTEPALGVFTPEFVKQSGQKPDDSGVARPVNYYTLKWTWSERSDTQYAIIEQAAALLSDPVNASRLVDLQGTRMMQCVDNLRGEELAALVGGNAQDSLQLQQRLTSATANALPASASEF